MMFITNERSHATAVLLMIAVVFACTTFAAGQTTSPATYDGAFLTTTPIAGNDWSVQEETARYFDAIHSIGTSMKLSEYIATFKTKNPDAQCTPALAMLGHNIALALNSTMELLPYAVVVTDEHGDVFPELRDGSEGNEAFAKRFYGAVKSYLIVRLGGGSTQAEGNVSVVCAKSTPTNFSNLDAVATFQAFAPQVDLSQEETLEKDLLKPFLAKYANATAADLELLGLSKVKSFTDTIANFSTTPTPPSKKKDDSSSGLSKGTIVGIVLGCICGVLIIIGFIAMKRKEREDAEYHEITGGPPKMEAGSPVLQHYKDIEAFKRSPQQMQKKQTQYSAV